MCDKPCSSSNRKRVCVPSEIRAKPRLVPENLTSAGIPSYRPRCCQDPRLMQTCKPQYFEPPYCMEPDDMTKLVSHSYKQRWIDAHQQWAELCAEKAGRFIPSAPTVSGCRVGGIRTCVSGRSVYADPQRQRPEDLPVAGMPSYRPRCCQDARLMDTCNPRYFEPSYCQEADNMSKLVSHEYKERWINDRRDWAVRCCRDSSLTQYRAAANTEDTQSVFEQNECEGTNTGRESA